MLTEQDAQIVREYFAVFNPTPPVALDPKGLEDESYILIDGGGLSIGKQKTLFDTGLLNRPGWRYTVHNHEGEEDYSSRSFTDAIRFAMQQYAAELFRRVNDRLTTDAQAEAYNAERLNSKAFRS